MKRGAILALPLVLLAACGGGGKPDKNADGVRATAKSFVSDIADKKFDDACGLLTTAAKAQLTKAGGGGECSKQLSLARGLLSDKQLTALEDQADKMKVTIKGDTATSAPISANDTPGKYVWQGEKWLIDAG
jgi:hypothetical protein